MRLEDAATQNIAKREDRWPTKQKFPAPTDEGLHVDEQLPRKMRVLIYEREVNGTKYVFQKTGGVLLGDRLTDNHMPPDDYRFHDVFHLAPLSQLAVRNKDFGVVERRKRESDQWRVLQIRL